MADNTAVRMMEEYYGAYRSNIIYWTAKLNIAEHLLKQPMTTEELAQVINAHLPTLRRFLRYLTVMGIVKQDSNKRFSVTEYGSTLAESHENSVRNVIVLFTDTNLKAADDFDHMLRTGEVAFNHKFGLPFFDYLNEDSGPGIVDLTKFLTEYIKMVGCKISKSYDFSQFNTIVDVGGNIGTLLVEILENTPANVHGIVFDQPNVVKKAVENIAKHNLSERCETVGGNFHEWVPAGGDCYILKFILNDWNDENCVRVLSNISKHMKGESKLLIMEHIDSEEGHNDILVPDYLNLVLLGGSHRRLSEHERLLNKANLKVVRLTKIGAHNFSIVEAIKR